MGLKWHPWWSQDLEQEGPLGKDDMKMLQEAAKTLVGSSLL